MAPEVTTGHCDIAADLNSLRIVLSELMCVELEKLEKVSALITMTIRRQKSKLM